MRVLSFFLSALLFFGISGAIIAVVGREVMLTRAIWQVRDSLREMRQIAAKGEAYTQECQKRGALNLNQAGVGTIQLRFTSANEYAVEVLCTDFSFDPIVVSSEKLPWRVTKKSSTSGIIWGDERSGVTLEFFGRSRAILVEDREIFTVSGQTTALGTGPRTNCAGFGYQCCIPESSAGVGEQLAQATDCPRTCYQSCQARPLVLSLVSQPFLDVETRTLTMGPGEPVEFSYVGSMSGPAELKANFTFGDGAAETLTGTSNKVSHTYLCPQAECLYEMTLTLVDGQGVESYPTPISKVTVKVGAQYRRDPSDWDVPDRY
jgi:hypothetical protein